MKEFFNLKNLILIPLCFFTAMVIFFLARCNAHDSPKICPEVVCPKINVDAIGCPAIECPELECPEFVLPERPAYPVLVCPELKCPKLRVEPCEDSDAEVTSPQTEEKNSLLFDGDYILLGKANYIQSTNRTKCRDLKLTQGSCFHVFFNNADLEIKTDGKANWYKLEREGTTGIKVYNTSKTVCIPANIGVNSCIHLNKQ